MKNNKIFLIKTSVGTVLASRNLPVLKDLLKTAGVKQGSYAAELIKRIYTFFIDTAIDLMVEYQKYYEVEYADMTSFLYHKYAMNKKYLSKLSASLKSCGCLLLLEDIRWGRDYQIESLLDYPEEDYNVVLQVLNAEFIGASDED